MAYLKFSKFTEAESDCSRILEFSEVLEDGYTRSRDANFKGFTRRAQARVELKKFDEAIADVESALELFPKDQGGLDLLEEVKKAKSLASDIAKLDEKITKDEFGSPDDY